jgi:hypothetical protein
MRNKFSFLFLFAVMYLPGCVGGVSYTLPPAISASESLAITQTNFQFSVGMAGGAENPVSSAALRDALGRTAMFFEVDDLANLKVPEELILLARVERTIQGSSTFPLLTLWTFGLIPTFIDQTNGFVFSLAPLNDPSKKIFIEYLFESRTTLGLIAKLRCLLFDETCECNDVEYNKRLSDGLAASLLEHRDAIRDLR